MAELELIQRYEQALKSLFKQLKVNGVTANLIRSLITASGGDADFEISHLELGKLYCPDETSDKKVKEKVRYSVNQLKAWQRKHKCQLVRISKGRKQVAEDGSVTYVKSRYRFDLISGFTEALSCESESERTERIATAIATIKERYEPSKPKKRYVPRKDVKAARKTIMAMFRAIYKLAPEIEDFEPNRYCNLVLNEAKRKVKTLQQEYEHNKNIAAVLKQYDELANSAESTA